MTRAFLCLACHETLSWRFLSTVREGLCIFCIAALQQSLFNVRREWVSWFSSKRCTSSRSASISGGPLLLPRGVCRNSGTPPPSRCSVLFGKPAAPPPAAGFFVLEQRSAGIIQTERVNSALDVETGGYLASACRRCFMRARAPACCLARGPPSTIIFWGAALPLMNPANALMFGRSKRSFICNCG
jgi:hypothetical protein